MSLEPWWATTQPADAPVSATVPVRDRSVTSGAATSRTVLSTVGLTSTWSINPIVQPVSS